MTALNTKTAAGLTVQGVLGEGLGSSVHGHQPTIRRVRTGGMDNSRTLCHDRAGRALRCMPPNMYEQLNNDK